MTDTNWLKAIFDSWNSKATTTFVLHGNTSDIFLGKTEELSLKNYIIEKAGERGIVLHADPASGITIEAGSDELADFDPAGLRDGPVMENLHRILLSLSNEDKTFAPVVFISNPAYLVGKQNDARGALLLKRWSEDPHFRKDRPFIVLLADSLKELHPVVDNCQRIEKTEVPFPCTADIHEFLTRQLKKYPEAVEGTLTDAGRDRFVDSLTGTSLQNLDALIKKQAYLKKPLRLDDLEAIKQKLVAQESHGMIEFLPTKQTLEDLDGEHMAAIKERIESDLILWKEGQTQLIPNGILFVGPPGTGKTYFMRCLAGTAARYGIPIVKINNFRGEFQGETEGNLELIFRLIRTLKFVIIFIDEADQSMGSRDQGRGDSGVSSRVYSAFAQEMSNTDYKGSRIWALATSHPHLLEPDIKRPGRIDVKIPLLPCEDAKSGERLLKQIATRSKFPVEGALTQIPELLTPGAATIIIEEAIRRRAKGKSEETNTATVQQVLNGFQPPDPQKMNELTEMAVRESTSTDFVPKAFRDRYQL